MKDDLSGRRDFPDSVSGLVAEGVFESRARFLFYEEAVGAVIETEYARNRYGGNVDFRESAAIFEIRFGEFVELHVTRNVRKIVKLFGEIGIPYFVGAIFYVFIQSQNRSALGNRRPCGIAHGEIRLRLIRFIGIEVGIFVLGNEISGKRNGTRSRRGRERIRGRFEVPRRNTRGEVALVLGREFRNSFDRDDFAR